MAQVVAGIGVPHSPHYPSKIARDGPEETARLYREVASHLDAAAPDAIVVFANDHFNTFFLDNFPTFAIGAGSFSLEIGGPKLKPGERTSGPDLAWSRRVHSRIEQAQFDELVAEATPEQMWNAGNIGGELLNWIALLGVVGRHKPHVILGQEKEGHAFAVCRWN